MAKTKRPTGAAPHTAVDRKEQEYWHSRIYPAAFDMGEMTGKLKAIKAVANLSANRTYTPQEIIKVLEGV